MAAPPGGQHSGLGVQITDRTAASFAQSHCLAWPPVCATGRRGDGQNLEPSRSPSQTEISRGKKGIDSLPAYYQAASVACDESRPAPNALHCPHRQQDAAAEGVEGRICGVRARACCCFAVPFAVPLALLLTLRTSRARRLATLGGRAANGVVGHGPGGSWQKAEDD